MDETNENRSRSNKEVQKELEKNNGQAWENDGIAYIKGRIYVLNNRKI